MLFLSLLLTAGQCVEVVELNLPNSNKVVIKLMFRNGSISDPEGKSGLTHLTASLMTQGATKEYSYERIQELIYPMAAQYGALVDKEVTTFTFAVHTDFYDQFYPILKSVILSPAFEKSDFNRIRSNQQAYVDQIIRAASDEEYSKKALEDLLFRGTNYQYPVEGNSASVAGLTLGDVRSHYEGVFIRENLTVGIAGNYTSDQLETLLADLESLPGDAPSIATPGSARVPDGIDIEIIAKDGAFGSAIFTGFPLKITRSDDEFAALMVANSFLGEHRKSYGRLYQQIRELRSINYGNYSYIEWYHAGGSFQLPPPGVPRSSNYFALWIRPVQIARQLKAQYEELSHIEIGHAHFTLRMAIRESDLLVKNGMSEEDFQSTREFLRSYIKLYIQSTGDQLGYLMDSRFYGRTDYIRELDSLLSQLSLQDVNNAIRRHWQTDNMFITIVTDRSEAAPLAESLRQNTPSPMSYSNLVRSGLSEEFLAVDDAVATFPLNVKSVRIIDSADTFK